MSIHITILGLDKIGASTGLALGKHSDQFERTGFDHKHTTAMQARKIKAVDQVELNIIKSVKQADIIFLALPLNLVKETLASIAPVVRSGVVIIDNSPAKQSVATWVSELIPTKCHYVGITPLLDPAHFDNRDGSIQSASTELFENSTMAIAAPNNTDAAALKLAADLSGLLGASPFFCDMAEMDGFTTSTRLLPQLVSAALLNATINQPGWIDAGKFSEAEYSTVSSGIGENDESVSLQEAIKLNKANILQSLDGMLTALYALRDDNENDQSNQLGLKLENARVGRLKWSHDRQNLSAANKELQATEMPKAGDYWKQQMGFLSRLSGPRPSKPEKKE